MIDLCTFASFTRECVVVVAGRAVAADETQLLVALLASAQARLLLERVQRRVSGRRRFRRVFNLHLQTHIAMFNIIELNSEAIHFSDNV